MSWLRGPRRNELIWAFLFLLPLLWTLGVAFAYAFFRALWWSFCDYDLFASPKFVGLANYAKLFADLHFLKALFHSLSFAVIVTFTQTFLALFLAIALNQKIRGLTFFRAAFYTPSILSSVIVGLIFIWFTYRRGVVNFLLTVVHNYYPYFLSFLGLVIVMQSTLVLWGRKRGFPVRAFDPVYLWISLFVGGVGAFFLGHFRLIQPKSMPPVDIIWLETAEKFLGIPRPLWAIMALNIGTTVPTMMLFFLAGLQDVPRELYEVAELDGASWWAKLWYVTIPALRPVMFLVITLGLIGTLQMFDQAAITSGVAPLDSVITLAYYVYWNMFGAGGLPRVGMAAAAAIFLAVLTLVVVLIQRRVGIGEKAW